MPCGTLVRAAKDMGAKIKGGIGCHGFLSMKIKTYIAAMTGAGQDV